MQQVWCKQLLKEKNITLAFVYTAKSETSLRLKLAASNEYQVFVNGKFLAYGPMRSAHGYSHIRTYPLVPDENGRIAAAVLVCGAQINSYDRVNEQPFFAAEILSSGQIIANSLDFKAFHVTDRLQKVQRYSFQRTFTESYRITSDRENLLRGLPCNFPAVALSEINGNTLLPENSLSEPDYHFVTGKAYEQGRAFTDENRPIYRDRSLTGETCVDGFLRFDENILEEVLSAEAGKIVCRPDSDRAHRLTSNRYVAYDLGQNTSGFFRFYANVFTKTTLYFLFDEIATPKDGEGLFIDINRLQCCNAIKYVFEKGNYSVTSFAPYTAKYVRAVVLEGATEINDFGMVTYENPDDSLDFTCEDGDLMKVIGAARATFRQNAVDVLTDCPSRERAGWLCDSYFTARAEKFLTGENRVEKNFLQSYLLAPEFSFGKGMVPMCYPADHIDGVYIPNWAMWFIVELKDFLARTGDREFVEQCRDKVYGIIRFLDCYLNEYGLLENLESWVFLEWSKANEFVGGVNFPSNMMYALALQSAAELYGDEEFSIRHKKMQKTICAMSYNGEFFVDQALRDRNHNLILTNNISETCQYYAFWTGIAQREDYPVLYETMLKYFSNRDPEKVYPYVYPSNAFIGRLLRMDYFLRQKEYATVLNEAKKYYLPMAQSTGTLWENLTTIASCNHGFSGYLAYILIHAYRASDGLSL